MFVKINNNLNLIVCYVKRHKLNLCLCNYFIQPFPQLAQSPLQVLPCFLFLITTRRARMTAAAINAITM